MLFRSAASSLAAKLVIPRPHEELEILFTPKGLGGKTDPGVRDEEELEAEGAAVGETVEEVVGDVVGEVEESPHPALPEKLDRQTLDSIIEK